VKHKIFLKRAYQAQCFIGSITAGRKDKIFRELFFI